MIVDVEDKLRDFMSKGKFMHATPEVVVHILSIFDQNAYVLLNLGATYFLLSIHFV